MPTFDPELKAVFDAIAQSQEGATPPPPPARGDWQSIRQMGELMMLPAIEGFIPMVDNVSVEQFSCNSADGTAIDLHWYKPAQSETKAAVVYVHGGGKILGSVKIYDRICRLYADRADVAILFVEYRLAPEHPYPAPVEDCYAGLEWLANNAEKLGVDLNRVGIAGDSGGGGIAAGVALMARDRKGPAIAKQLLVYPMLDDRNTVEDPALAPFAVWSYDQNYTGWHCFLGDAIGTDDVSPYASPSRETDLSGLPDTFIDIGELDIFRDECIDYATRCVKDGVSVEFHYYPGAPHGFEVAGFSTKLGSNAWDARFRALNMLNLI